MECFFVVKHCRFRFGLSSSLSLVVFFFVLLTFHHHINNLDNCPKTFFLQENLRRMWLILDLCVSLLIVLRLYCQKLYLLTLFQLVLLIPLLLFIYKMEKKPSINLRCENLYCLFGTSAFYSELVFFLFYNFSLYTRFTIKRVYWFTGQSCCLILLLLGSYSWLHYGPKNKKNHLMLILELSLRSFFFLCFVVYICWLWRHVERRCINFRSVLFVMCWFLMLTAVLVDILRVVSEWLQWYFWTSLLIYHVNILLVLFSILLITCQQRPQIYFIVGEETESMMTTFDKKQIIVAQSLL